MAGYKETPRQKMISMMYLVLYALLALNVSKEVLNAFLVVNQSMVSTNESLTEKIASTSNRFQQQYMLQPEKVGSNWEKAKALREQTDAFLAYLDHIKLKLIEVAQEEDSATVIQKYYRDTLVPSPLNDGEMVKKKVLDLSSVPNKNRYNNPTEYLIGNEQLKTGEAYKLSRRMTVYRDSILKIMMLPDTTTKIGLNTNYLGNKKIIYRNADGQKQNWEMHNFYLTILAADITLINKIISDTKAAEFDALNYLFSSVTEKDYKFSNIKPIVIPRSTYILQGNNYEADVMAAAYDKKTNPKVRILSGNTPITDKNINHTQLIQGHGGIVKLKFPAGRPGQHNYTGTIEMVNPSTNEKTKYPFEFNYLVAPPSLTVAPLKMNVFYIGLENPVSITAPGFAEDKIRPSISAGQLYRKEGHWIVKIDKPIPGNMVYVSATAIVNGKPVLLGKSPFRVKRVPDPVAQIAGLTNGGIDRNTFLAAGAIIPTMKDFEFDLYFVVTSYTFATIINGDWIPQNVTGNRFTPQILKLIRNARPHQKFFFENIEAKGPDGTIRSLNPITLEIK